MFRVSEHVARTDTGHQRATNEDSHLERAPVFAVADGMGGAQAGEVASQLAIERFAHEFARQDGEDATVRLVRAARDANAAIHELSQSDARRAGMGTTLTAAYVGGDQVFFAHVGDSRAYRLRHGELVRITEDHSLVEELLRQGRLTAEEAEEHPQRSIITRALGPEPDVDIDTFAVDAQDDDVYLLCSDGLSSMLSEQAVAEILRSNPDLPAAADALVAAALAAGGRDNVTVVLFRVESVGAAASKPPAEPPETAEQDAVTDPTEQDTAVERDAALDAPTEPTALVDRVSVASASRPGRAVKRSPRPARRLAPRMPRRGDRLHRRRRRITLAVVLVTVIAVLAVAVLLAAQSIYFVNTDANGQVTVFNGLPYTLPLGIRLYTPFFVSGVTVDELSPVERSRLFNNELRSQGSATALVSQLEREDRRTVNQPIARLFVVVLVLFAVLIGFTSRWSVFEASALRANPDNKRPGLENQYVARGAIVDAEGTAIARSVRQPGGRYTRSYPFGALFASPVGFYDPYNGATELERFRSGVLAGAPVQQSSILDQLSGRPTTGDEVVTTLDEHAQQLAYQALAGRDGAVVAMVPSTGAIRVMAASPSFDPNQVANPAAFKALNHDPAAPLVNRATAAQYAPGSTFKVVTAIAAIDTGRYTPASVINGNSPIVVSGQPLSNDSGTSYGPVSLSDALTNSINTVWAQVALKVGASTLQDYMDRLGFYRTPPIDLPADELAVSGVRYPGHPGYLPLASGADIGRVGIGEGGLEVTPLQMVMVASAVANGGRLMVPHLTSEIVNADGQVVQRVTPELYRDVMKPSTAQEVGGMMENVVRDGTGTAAALAGITVAGKTGTAQDCTSQAVCDTSQVWFIAYAPVPNPQIAIAVTIAHQVGFGGSIAAPIARQVLQALLGTHA